LPSFKKALADTQEDSSSQVSHKYTHPACASKSKPILDIHSISHLLWTQFLAKIPVLKQQKQSYSTEHKEITTLKASKQIFFETWHCIM
jgi:hypothetical protein